MAVWTECAKNTRAPSVRGSGNGGYAGARRIMVVPDEGVGTGSDMAGWTPFNFPFQPYVVAWTRLTARLL